jgi:hypothetical protein
MKLIYLIFTLFITMSFNTYAELPMPDSGPLLQLKHYSLKDLNLTTGSFKQSVKDIKVSNENIEIIPEISPLGTEPHMTNITFVSICLEKKLTQDEFKKLRFAEVIGVSYVPAVETSPKYSSTSGITIGSNGLDLTVTAPVVGNNLNKGIVLSHSTDTVISDPLLLSSHRSSSQMISEQYVIYSNFGSSYQVAPLKPYQYFIMSLNIKSATDPEAFFYLPKDQVENEFISSIGYDSSLNPDFASYYGYATNYKEGTMRITDFGADLGTETTTMSSAAYVYSGSDVNTSSEIKDPKVEFCWKTNNYETITTNGAKLIQPRLTLGFIN